MKIVSFALRSVFMIPSLILRRIGFKFYATPYELHDINISSWFRAKGDQTYRLDYPLNSASIVFDVGGFRGDWAESILNRYHCRIHVFEPIPEHVTMLQQRFSGNSNISIHPIGLAGKTRNQKIGTLALDSSVFKIQGSSITASFQDVKEIFEQLHINRIDLMKINIEGIEYELLERLIETGLIKMITDIQVQFHEFVPGAEILRNRIRAKLKETHHCTYNFSFVWENWKHNK